MSPALRREHHSQSKSAPRAGESSILPSPDGAHDHVSKQNEHRAEAGSTILDQNVHRMQARNPKVLQRSGGGAPAVAARTLQVSVWTRLMSAARGRAQRNEFNVHLDSAGDRFGAVAHGGWRRRISGVAEK